MSDDRENYYINIDDEGGGVANFVKNNTNNTGTPTNNNNNIRKVPSPSPSSNNANNDRNFSPMNLSVPHGHLEDNNGYAQLNLESPSESSKSWNYGSPPQQQQQEEENLSIKSCDSSSSVTKYVYIYTLCAAINSCNLGFDIGVNTEASLLLKDSMNLSDFQIEIFMGSLDLFAMVGALCSHYISDKYGRRRAFALAAIDFIIGVSIMSLSQDFHTLMIGRLFVGLGIGFGLALDPLYIAEISPAAHRGRLVTWSEISLNIGILFGFCTGFIFRYTPARYAWRYMFGLGAVLPCVMILLVIFVMPESPRWLVQKNKEEKAIPILRKIYSEERDFDVGPILSDMKKSIEKDAKESVGWEVLFFPSPAIKRMLIVGICIAASQQLVGIDAIQYFLSFILYESGLRNRTIQSLVLISLGFIKLISIFVAGTMFDRSGRRPMLFFSMGGMIVALLMISLSFHHTTTNDDDEQQENENQNKNAVVIITGLSIYLASFSLGMGPGAWLIPSEIFTLSIRGKAMSVVTFFNRGAGALMSSTFLTIADKITYSGFFLLLAFINILILVFIYLYVPETKGKALEDMAEYFAEITHDENILRSQPLRRERKKPNNNNNNNGRFQGRCIT